MKNIHSLSLAAVLSAATLIFTGCQPGGDADKAFDKAILPDAELVAYADFEAMSSSPFGKWLDEKTAENLSPEAAASAEEAEAKLKELTGLGDDDFLQGVLSLKGLEEAKMNPDAILFAGALLLDAPVTAEQADAALRYFAEQNGSPYPGKVQNGNQILIAKTADNPDILLQFDPAGGRTTVTFGDPASVALVTGGEGAAISDVQKAPSAGLAASQQGWVSFVLPESLKEEVSRNSGSLDQMAPGASAIGSLQAAGLGMGMDTNFNLGIGLTLGSAEDAATIRGILENQVISMVRMMASNQIQGPLPVLDSLAATAEGDRVVLNLSFGEQDVKTLGDTFGALLGGMGMGMPGSEPQGVFREE